MEVMHPGIEWQRISGKTWRVTIRREPEYRLGLLEHIQQQNMFNAAAHCSALQQQAMSNAYNPIPVGMGSLGLNLSSQR